MEQLTLTKDEELDLFQVALKQFEQVDCPLRHVFLKGVYARQIFMPKDTVVISKVHRTCHPFIVTEGKAAVYNKIDDFLGMIEAPYVAMTPAGTRRVLHVIEDCYWTTLHKLDYITGDENSWSDNQKEALLMKIEQDLIEERIVE